MQNFKNKVKREVIDFYKWFSYLTSITCKNLAAFIMIHNSIYREYY